MNDLPRCLIALAGALVLLFGQGCGVGTYQPARSAGFELDPEFEINDEDVQKAFDARPQLPEKVAVSYYSFASDKAEAVGALIEDLPRVASSYRIPELLVSGHGRFEDSVSYYAPPQQPFSLKKLRLLAARARTDVVVVFDYGHRYRQSANGWAATGIVLIPLLFAPWLDVEVESYLDAYLFDVRNGYLYAHVTSQVTDTERFESVYSGAREEMLARQWEEIVADVAKKLSHVLENPEHEMSVRASAQHVLRAARRP